MFRDLLDHDFCSAAHRKKYQERIKRSFDQLAQPQGPPAGIAGFHLSVDPAHGTGAFRSWDVGMQQTAFQLCLRGDPELTLVLTLGRRFLSAPLLAPVLVAASVTTPHPEPAAFNPLILQALRSGNFLDRSRVAPRPELTCSALPLSAPAPMLARGLHRMLLPDPMAFSRPALYASLGSALDRSWGAIGSLGSFSSLPLQASAAVAAGSDKMRGLEPAPCTGRLPFRSLGVFPDRRLFVAADGLTIGTAPPASLPPVAPALDPLLKFTASSLLPPAVPALQRPSLPRAARWPEPVFGERMIRPVLQPVPVQQAGQPLHGLSSKPLPGIQGPSLAVVKPGLPVMSLSIEREAALRADVPEPGVCLRLAAPVPVRLAAAAAAPAELRSLEIPLPVSAPAVAAEAPGHHLLPSLAASQRLALGTAAGTIPETLPAALASAAAPPVQPIRAALPKAVLPPMLALPARPVAPFGPAASPIPETSVAVEMRAGGASAFAPGNTAHPSGPMAFSSRIAVRPGLALAPLTEFPPVASLPEQQEALQPAARAALPELNGALACFNPALAPILPMVRPDPSAQGPGTATSAGHWTAPEPQLSLPAFRQQLWPSQLEQTVLQDWRRRHPHSPLNIAKPVRPGAPLVVMPRRDRFLYQLKKQASRYSKGLAAAIALVAILGLAGSRWTISQVIAAEHQRIREGIGNRATLELEDNFHGGLRMWEGRPNWTQSWSHSSDGFMRTGQLALYRPSMTMSDYTVEFLAQIERRSVGWVFRARDPQNYYALKLTVIDPGPRPLVAVVRYPVVDGQKGRPVQIPLQIMMHNNRPYQIRLDVRGHQFTTFVEGQVVDSWSDDRFGVGGVGFFSEPGERARVYWVKLSNNTDLLGRLCALLALNKEKENVAEGPSQVIREKRRRKI